MSNHRISSTYALIVCCSALVRSGMADCASNNVLIGGSAPPTTSSLHGQGSPPVLHDDAEAVANLEANSNQGDVDGDEPPRNQVRSRTRR